MGQKVNPIGLRINITVITSYSIHYTKLYDFHRVAAEEHQPRRRHRRDGDTIAGAEDQQRRCGEGFARDLHLALDDVDRAFLVVGVEWRGSSGGDHHLGVEPRRGGP